MSSLTLKLSAEDVRQLLWEGLISRGFKPAKGVKDVTLDLEVRTDLVDVWENESGKTATSMWGREGWSRAKDSEGNGITEEHHTAVLRGGEVRLALLPLDDRLLPPEWARRRGR